jgi:chromosome segregation ATPase
MKSALTLLSFCLLAWLWAVPGQAQTPPSEPLPNPQQLAAEIRQLRIELLRQKLEFQAWKTQQIERELQQAQTEQQRLDEEEQRIHQELVALSAATESPAEAETLKAELSGERLPRLRTRQQPASDRVNELKAKFQQEETRLRQFMRQLRSVTGEKTP